MWTLVSNQGTATPETSLCDKCFGKLKNQQYAREQARKTTNIDPNKGFIQCFGNEAINCCVCGNKSDLAKIVRWYVCLVDSNDCEERLYQDIPDDITSRIDEMIEAEYDVSWEK